MQRYVFLGLGMALLPVLACSDDGGGGGDGALDPSGSWFYQAFFVGPSMNCFAGGFFTLQKSGSTLTGEYRDIGVQCDDGNLSVAAWGDGEIRNGSVTRGTDDVTGPAGSSTSTVSFDFGGSDWRNTGRVIQGAGGELVMTGSVTATVNLGALGTVTLTGSWDAAGATSGGGGDTTGDLVVLVSTTGQDLDPDGYVVSVDFGSRRAIEINGSTSYSGLTAGGHLVQLGGVAANCTVNNANPQAVTISSGVAEEVSFNVTCASLGAWTFSIIAGVTQETASHYGGLANAEALIRAQMDSVMSRFNEPGVFAADFRFVVDSVYIFSGDAFAETCKPHPSHDYRIIYDGFPPVGGGWRGDCQAIYHSWPVGSSGGTFAESATDGLTHELGHARGAIDLYRLEVEAANNPISQEEYRAAVSIMNFPYGTRVWDSHSINLINETGSTPAPPIEYITGAFPFAMGVRVVDTDGAPVSGAGVELYPKRWLDQFVTSTATLSGVTDSNGEFVFPANPFEPDTRGEPWHIRYCNFVVRVRVGDRSRHTWLPLTTVQDSYFDNPGTSFWHNVTFTQQPSHQLIASVNGQGTVTSSPAGISCPGDCQEDYASGTTVILTADSASGWNFDRWEGDCTNTTPTCTVVMDTDHSVTAAFAGPEWVQLSPRGVLPEGRFSHSAVYDSDSNRMIVFGGEAEYPTLYNDVWVLANANGIGGTPEWIQIEPVGSPPAARKEHTAVCDPGSNRMIIYGGQDFANVAFSDVWILLNASGLGGTPEWIELAPTSPSPGHSSHTAVYDQLANRMIVFGGFDPSLSSNAIWLLTNANGIGGTAEWRELTPPDPYPGSIVRHTAVYDSASNRMIVFGENVPTGQSQLWVLTEANGVGAPSEWIQLAPAGGAPPDRLASHSAVYDPRSNRMIVFGGCCFPNEALWLLIGANGLSDSIQWVAPTLAGTIPPVLTGHGAVFDEGSDRMIVFGGSSENSNDHNAVWLLLHASGRP